MDVFNIENTRNTKPIVLIKFWIILLTGNQQYYTKWLKTKNSNHRLSRCIPNCLVQVIPNVYCVALGLIKPSIGIVFLVQTKESNTKQM